MIYILTGMAKSGKSLIAKEVLRLHQIPYFSTDYFMMSLALANPTLGVDYHDDDQVVAKALEPYLHAMIKVMIQNKIVYLLEGVHFNPDFSATLLKEFPTDISILYLGYANAVVSDKVSELRKYAPVMENCWFQTLNDEQMNKLVEFMIMDSKRVQKSCKELSLPYMEVTNITLQMDRIIRELIGKIT
jgi:gluconate kinase